MNFKKTFLTIIGAVIVLLIVREGWNFFDPAPAVIASHSTPHVPGWNYIGREIGLNWYSPEHTDKPTEPVKIQGYNFDDGVETWCIMKLIKDDGQTRTFKADPVTGLKYLEKSPGKFEDKPWDIGEYTAFGLKSQYVQFIPLPGIPLDVKVGLRKGKRI